jgi:hypothetical protein
MSPRADQTLSQIKNNIYDYMEKFKGTDPVTGDEYITFGNLEQFKREWQRIVAQHNGFMVPDAALSNELSSYRTASNATRPFMEKNAPAAWAESNAKQHQWLNILDIGTDNYVKDLGKVASPYKRTVTGFGAKLSTNPLNDKAGMLLRTLRSVEDSPAVRNKQAQLAWKLAKMMGGRGFKVSQMADMVLSPDITDYADPSEIGPVNNAALKIGTIEEGYRFKGGDPSRRESWEKVE